MPPSSDPRFVYKILPAPPPDPLPQSLPLSPLDRQDGFIHLSTAQQAPLTCHRFFRPSRTLWLLKLGLARFADPVKWEDGFPHLYGNLGRDDVLAVEKFERAEGQTWMDVMGASTWLE